MSRALVLVEGLTEREFIRNSLSPYLATKGIFLSARISSQYPEKGPNRKGGISDYANVKKDVITLLHDSDLALVTTMIDFYGLSRLRKHGQFPGQSSLPKGTCYQRVAYLEARFRDDIGSPRFLPYFSLHEFEAFLFVLPEKIVEAFPDLGEKALEELIAIRNQFKSPEEIDDNPQTAPSKRLRKLCPQYDKAIDGPLIVSEIGIDTIRQQCPHFDEWLTKLESLGAEDLP